MIALNIHTRAGASGAVIELTGDLDHLTAPALREMLVDIALEQGQQLVIDLAGLGFCDSSGITALLTARNHALSAQATLALTATPAALLRLFDFVGLAEIFPHYPTTQEAEAAWKPSVPPLLPPLSTPPGDSGTPPHPREPVTDGSGT